MNGQLHQLPLGLKPHKVQPSQRRKPNDKPRLQRKNSPLWYAVCLPQLEAGRVSSELNQTQPSTQEKLQQLAERFCTVSSKVCIEPPHCLVFETRSTLKYFGGIEKIRSQVDKIIRTQLESWQLPIEYYQAAAPTPSASLLLAQAGYNLVIHQQGNLRSALGEVSVQTLPIDSKKQRRQLHNSGIRTLRDVWRLPKAAMSQRFGTGFTAQLERCLGTIAQPKQGYESKPRFCSDIDFDFAVENTTLLQHAIQELIDRLSLFLQRRELAANHLCFELIHAQEPAKIIDIELRQASRSAQHFLLLSNTRLESLLLCAPVQTLRIKVERFSPFVAQKGSLDLLEKQDQDNIDQAPIAPLLEQLQAKLGKQSVKGISYHREHAPEHASGHHSYGSICSSATQTYNPPHNPRPCWLLPAPLKLDTYQGKLFYRSSLMLISGPERIETRWWSSMQIERDYYVAHNRAGMRLWIFHERQGSRNWYLHGVFS
ncbi:MAG: DNA polymerase Y family protein [Pseudohongiellaceae bacterium]|nr:DNA polymerase Y family protein [Pseudohongiellaceae bacterium]